jgi:hypothetical protein
MNRTLRKVALPGVGLVLATSGFAFMATNTVAASSAGQGRHTISGFDVSHIHYTFVSDSGNNPNLDYIKSVTFTLDQPASQVAADINNNQNTWVPYHDCTTTDSQTFTCSNSTGAAVNLNYPGGSPSASELSVDAVS